jgi:predicted enzyme related to lactoylglutathione lyase
MGQRTDYAPGTPCWVDLTTTDVADARRFYGEVLGWTAREAPAIDYTFFEREGAAVAGLHALADEQRAQGVAPAWSTYVRTDNADATAARAAGLGATVLGEGVDIPGAGRLAALADPQGALVLLWQPREFPGAAVVNEIGAWAWNDLQTTDPEGAAPFYEALFGWATAEVPGSGGVYRSVALEGRPIGGIMRAQQPIAQPYWTIYFGVDDADAALERVTAAGGRTLAEPMAVPSGRFAVAQDPQGAAFCVVDGQLDD